MKRKKIKTILCHMAIITICMGVFCHGYINSFSISKYDRIHSFAEADNWSSCDSSDLVTAFRYYCKSRNLAIEGSVADALTSFTTTTFNNICSTLGIDPTELQAEIKKTTGGNLGLRFLFSNTGVTAYNRIFAEFLQNNDLNVGDEVEDKVVQSGDYFTDNDGTGCYIFVSSYITGNGSIKQTYGASEYPYQQKGTYFKYDENFSRGLTANFTSPLINLSDSVSLSLIYKYYSRTNNNYSELYTSLSPNSNYITIYNYYKPKSSVRAIGYPCIIQGTNSKLYLGAYTWSEYDNTRTLQSLAEITNGTVEDGDISLTTNNSTINNNTYNFSYTIIYNDGDHYGTDDDEPLPSTPPGGGGGGGDNPGGDPDSWTPTEPTIPAPSSPSFPTVNLPDIDIPDLPSLNFSLGDLRNKFPFSLPFDIIAILNVLDGEPQAPHIEATVPIGRWYTWEMDFDFSEFDNYARIFRAFEFIGFCIGLVVFTVHFVKG